MHYKRIVFAAAALAALAPAAHAAVGPTLATTLAAAPAGGTGTFDVTLDNTTGSPVDIAVFSFELSVAPASGVTFTNADMNTTPYTYIFSGNSLDAGPPASPLSSDTFPTTDVTASDVTADFSNFVLAPGSTVGLGDISYAVAPGASVGPVPVSFENIGTGTSLSDASGANVGFTPVNGVITVMPAITVVPEASPFALLGLGLLPLGLLAAKRRRAA